MLQRCGLTAPFPPPPQPLPGWSRERERESMRPILASTVHLIPAIPPQIAIKSVLPGEPPHTHTHCTRIALCNVTQLHILVASMMCWGRGPCCACAGVDNGHTARSRPVIVTSSDRKPPCLADWRCMHYGPAVRPTHACPM